MVIQFQMRPLIEKFPNLIVLLHVNIKQKKILKKGDFLHQKSFIFIIKSIKPKKNEIGNE